MILTFFLCSVWAFFCVCISTSPFGWFLCAMCSFVSLLSLLHLLAIWWLVHLVSSHSLLPKPDGWSSSIMHNAVDQLTLITWVWRFPLFLSTLHLFSVWNHCCWGGVFQSEQFLLIHSQLKLSANRIVCYTNAGHRVCDHQGCGCA